MERLMADIRMIVKGLQEIRRIRPWLICLLILHSALLSIAPFINIYMSALIIDGIAMGQTWEQLLVLVGWTILLNFINGLCSAGLDRVVGTMKSEFEHRFEMTLSDKIIGMDYTAVENPETHRKLEKIRELQRMNNGGIWLLLDNFGKLANCLFTIAFSVALTFSLFTSVGEIEAGGLLAFIASPLFSVMLGLSIVASAFISMHANTSLTRKIYELSNNFVPFNRIFGYYVTNSVMSYHGGKDVRIYNQKSLIVDESMSFFQQAYEAMDKLSRSELRYANMNSAASITISFMVYLFVGLKALAGLFGVGSIVRYVGSINEFINGFKGFMDVLAALRANNQGLKMYFDFLAIPSQMYLGTLPVEKRNDNEYEIEFRDVSFKYPATEDHVLRHVSLKLKVGERLAVVGMNGSGKTTLIKLLCRLYDPTEGEILLNGIDIRKYDYQEYMSIFSVVFQDFKLLSFSLGQNVAASINYEESQVEARLEEAGFGQRLQTMEQGAATCLYKDFDEAGVEISGGEAQKIALARALYKDAPFIVLDEPTAALDPVAEFEIYSRFNGIVGDKTVIYISHRLSSCRFCDDIAVFHEGELIQRGSHDRLVADAAGKYHELWHAQAQYYAG